MMVSKEEQNSQPGFVINPLEDRNHDIAYGITKTLGLLPSEARYHVVTHKILNLLPSDSQLKHVMTM